MNISIKEKKYKTLFEAINNANNNDIITLNNNIILGFYGEPDNIIINKNIVLNLNSYSIYGNGNNGVIKIRGGITTINGPGKIQASFGEKDLYSIAIWCADGNLIINGGTYQNTYGKNAKGPYLIWATGKGIIEINDGIFKCFQPEWTLKNRLEDYLAGTSDIIVKGGKYYKFNPSEDVFYHNYETKNNVFIEGFRPKYTSNNYQSYKEKDYYIIKEI